MPMTDRLAPVVTFHAPLTLIMPSGTKNGTRFDTLPAPPANTVIDMAFEQQKLPGEASREEQAADRVAGCAQYLRGLGSGDGFILRNGRLIGLKWSFG